MRREPVLEAGAAVAALPVDEHLVLVPLEEGSEEGLEARLVDDAARALDDDDAGALACGLWGCLVPTTYGGFNVSSFFFLLFLYGSTW